MKKTLLSALALSAILALSGCGSDSTPAKQENNNSGNNNSGGTNLDEYPETGTPPTTKKTNLVKPLSTEGVFQQGGDLKINNDGTGGLIIQFGKTRLTTHMYTGGANSGLTEPLKAEMKIGMKIVADAPINTLIYSPADNLNLEAQYIPAGKHTTYLYFTTNTTIPDNQYFYLKSEANATVHIKEFELFQN